jgi:hypothetical protein
MWDSICNSDGLVANFAGELAKDVASKGSFRDDYLSTCLQYKITPCPYFASTAQSVRLSNCIVDLSSFRACLLAMSTINSTIIEFSVHSATLQPQMLLELSTTLEKMATLKVVKLEYLACGPDSFQPLCDSMKSLMGSNLCLDYLSLRGNKFGDGVGALFEPALSTNLCIKSVNLSDNAMTDIGAATVLQNLRRNTSLLELSLARNCISFEPSDILYDQFLSLLFGSASTSDDDAYFKALPKLIADRNKQLKDINKKRKKAGYTEIEDVATPAEAILKIGGQPRVVNRVLAFLDVSNNPQISSTTISALNAAATPMMAALLLAVPERRFVVKVKGAVLPADMPFVEGFTFAF